MSSLPSIHEETAIDRIKFALMDGIDAAIKSGGHRNYRQAALWLRMDTEQMYRLRARNTALFSVVWLINTAERLGAHVSVHVEPPSTMNCAVMPENQSTSRLHSVGVNRP